MPYLKPANKNLQVRNPSRLKETLPAHGEFVEHSVYWARRLRDGDVIEITEKEFKNAEAKHKKLSEEKQPKNSKAETKQ